MTTVAGAGNVDDPRNWVAIYLQHLEETRKDHPDGYADAQKAQQKLAEDIAKDHDALQKAAERAAADVRRQAERTNNARLIDALEQPSMFADEEDLYLPVGDGIRVVFGHARLIEMQAYKSIEASGFASQSMAFGTKMRAVDDIIARFGGDFGKTIRDL